MSQMPMLCFLVLTFLVSVCSTQGTAQQPNELERSNFDLERDDNDVEHKIVEEPEDREELDNDVEDEDADENDDEDNGVDDGNSDSNNEEDSDDDDDARGEDERESDGAATCSDSSDMCQMDIQPIGCFHDPVVRNRPLPVLSVSNRDRSSHAFNNVLFNWEKGTASIKRLLCDCVKVARKRGMSYIGLQHYGECWSSKTAAKDYDKQGPSKACVNGKYKPCKPGEFCAGKEHANYVYAINSLNPVPCNVMYETVGCFYDPVKIKHRPLPYLLESRRDRTSHAFFGKFISWKNYHTSLAELVCACAQRAKAKGYKYFGIQYFGECWSGPGSHSYRKYGTSTRCKSAAFQQCTVKAGSKKCLCTGDQHSNYVYKLI